MTLYRPEAQTAEIRAQLNAQLPALSTSKSAQDAQPVRTTDSPWSPINPTLDLARVETRPARPDGRPPPQPPTAAAVSAGKTLSPILDRAQRTSLIGVRVLDRNGTTVGGTAEVGQNFAHVWEVRQALSGRYAAALRARELENAPSEITTFSRGTGVRVFVALPITAGEEVLGAVYLSRTPKSILRHMYEEQEKALLALAFVLVMAISLAMLTSRTISRPIAQLLARTQRVARGETAHLEPLKHHGTREMAELSDGIARMATALSDRASYIRTLARQVSHEFKTPLTSIEGAAELLRDHHDTMTAEERQRFLENISKGGTRLRALLDRLLDLARAENTVNTDMRSDLALTASAAASGLPDAVDTRFDIPDDMKIRIDEEALRIVLLNLFDNATQHGASKIRMSATRHDDIVLVTISDNGGGISDANRSKIFEHFFTTRRTQGGTGLGLGIVRALLGAHGGTIDLDQTGPDGTTFRLSMQA